MHQRVKCGCLILGLMALMALGGVDAANAKPKAEKAAKKREVFKKKLTKEFGKREDGLVLLALEESADGPVSITFKVAKGRDAAVDAIAEFVELGGPTNRGFQVLGWYDDDAEGKVLTDNHRSSLQRSIENRFKAPRFTLEACYSDLGNDGQSSLADRLKDGRAIRYLPFQ